MNEANKPGENGMKSTRQEPDDAGRQGPDDEGPVRTGRDTCTRQEPDGVGPVRSAHRMKGHIRKCVP